MSWTKRQFVEQAYEEIGYGSTSFDIDADTLQSAKRRLDSMLATWEPLGLITRYPFVSNSKTSDLDTETNVPEYANEAIYLNLAIRLCPSVGKAASADLRTAAKAAYNQLGSTSATPNPRQLDGLLPRGAGNKRSINEQPFLRQPDDKIIVNGDELDLT